MTGSSPRGRGTPSIVTPGNFHHRFIPAWAGNTHKPIPGVPVDSVHPRVGGEHREQFPSRQFRFGSSPRGRGTRSLDYEHCESLRFIPAWAGNTPLVPGPGSSPRGRGTLARIFDDGSMSRFIPAWAGNTSSSKHLRPMVAVHPRVGGEHTASLGDL